MNTKVLYQTNSGFNAFTFFFWEVMCVVIIFSGAVAFSHSPGSSVLAMVVAFIFLLANSRGSVIVTEDKFMILNKRLLPGFSDRNEFAFADVARIEANLSLTPATGILNTLFATGHDIVVKNTLSITGKDGSVTQLSPKIYKDELRKAVLCIQKHSHVKVEIQGDDI